MAKSKTEKEAVAILSDCNANVTGAALNTLCDTTGSNTWGQVNVDNLRLDGNTLSSTNTNGNINITPNGVGVVSMPTLTEINNTSDSVQFNIKSDVDGNGIVKIYQTSTERCQFGYIHAYLLSRMIASPYYNGFLLYNDGKVNIESKNSKDLELTPAGNVNITANSLEMAGTTVITSARLITNTNAIISTGWVDVAYSELSAGKTIIAAVSGIQFSICDIDVAVVTPFSGGGGDRLLSITDNTSTWSVMPAATIQAAAANYRWGTGVDLPLPATASHFYTACVANTAIVAKYSGGAADYTAGALKIRIRYRYN